MKIWNVQSDLVRGRNVTVARFLVAFALLNLLWETGQLPFYTLWRDGTWTEIAVAIVHCTAGDILIGAVSLASVLLVVGRHWPETFSARATVAVAFVVVGLGYTIYSEWHNVVVRKSWTYSDLMPILPPFGTGLAPTLQWMLVPLLAFWLARGPFKCANNPNEVASNPISTPGRY